MSCSIFTSCHIVTVPVVAGSMAGLLAGGDNLPTDQLPGAKKRKVTPKKGLRPAFVRRVAGKHRKLAVHDLIRPVQTATEVALFVHLLPGFRTGSKVNYWGMAIEFNNRLLQAFNAGKPLDAYPKSSRELCQYGDAYVKQTRENDSLLMLGFTQALAPISPPPPAIFSPNAMAGQQQASALLLSPHFEIPNSCTITTAGCCTQHRHLLCTSLS